MSNTWIELGLSRPGPQRETPPAPVAVAPQPVADGPSPLVWLASELLGLLEVSVPEGGRASRPQPDAQSSATTDVGRFKHVNDEPDIRE